METRAATSVGETKGTLNGIVNPRGVETKYYFEYGTAVAYGSRTAEASAGSGTSGLEENTAITGLVASTTYHFRIVATNSHGTAEGAEEVFSTTGKPTVETHLATNVAETEGKLNGRVNRGRGNEILFEYGTTIAYVENG